MVVNTTSPIWFYCQQANHCQQGMVGAINAVETSAKSYEAFKALAMGGTAPSSTNSTGASGSGSPSTAAPSTSPTHSGGVTKVVRNAGAVLVAVGALVAVLL